MKKNVNIIIEKLGEEKLVIGIILVSIILLITTGPVYEKSETGESDLPVRMELSRMIDVDLSSSVPAAFFRVLMLIFLTMVVSGLVLNIQGIIGRNLEYFPSADSPCAGWGIWPVLKLAIYFFSAVLLFQRLETIFFCLTGRLQPGLNFQLVLINAFFQFSFMIILVVFFLKKYRTSRYFPTGTTAALVTPGRVIIDTSRRQRKTQIELLRMSRKYWKISFRRALRGYIIFFPVLIGLIIISQLGTKIMGVPYQPHPLVQPLLETGDPLLLIPLFMVGIILGPLAEELFFRGLFFPALKKKMKVLPAMIITSVLFSTLHLNWAGWLPIFGLGILLAYGYEKTGSLLVSIFIHMIHNSLFLTFAVLVYCLRTA